MLQQTTVEAVKPYFHAFTERWPDVNALAAATEDEILQAWAGLGYYSRARNLKKCADIVAGQFGGHFPTSARELQKLPGIGDYTSTAIAAIAFGEPVAVIDGNIERVITRLYRIKTPLPAAKKQIRAYLETIMPHDRPGDFAQALMDIGATICTPRRPSCLHCPVIDNCEALKKDDPENFPIKPPKPARPVRFGAAFIAETTDGAIFLRKRTQKGLLQNMAEVPGTDWNARQDGDIHSDAAPFPAQWRASGTIVHVFTHFELHLHVYHTVIAENLSRNKQEWMKEGWWSAPDQLNNEALPTVMKKAIHAALPERFAKISRKTKKAPA